MSVQKDHTGTRNKGGIFVVSAPSGAGKTTLCRMILSAEKRMRPSVSYTTRKPRRGERHGKDYFFVTEQVFRRKIAKGDFVEWAEVHGNLYGTDRAYLEEIIGRGDDVLLDIDTQGARQIRKAYRGCVFIFIMPPSLEDLRSRLERRASNTAEDMDRRLKNAISEIAAYKRYDYVIINADLQEAHAALRTVIAAERFRCGRLDPAWVRHTILRR